MSINTAELLGDREGENPAKSGGLLSRLRGLFTFGKSKRKPEAPVAPAESAIAPEVEAAGAEVSDLPVAIAQAETQSALEDEAQRMEADFRVREIISTGITDNGLQVSFLTELVLESLSPSRIVEMDEGELRNFIIDDDTVSACINAEVEFMEQFGDDHEVVNRCLNQFQLRFNPERDQEEMLVAQIVYEVENAEGLQLFLKKETERMASIVCDICRRVARYAVVAKLIKRLYTEKYLDLNDKDTLGTSVMWIDWSDELSADGKAIPEIRRISDGQIEVQIRELAQPYLEAIKIAERELSGRETNPSVVLHDFIENYDSDAGSVAEQVLAITSRYIQEEEAAASVGNGEGQVKKKKKKRGPGKRARKKKSTGNRDKGRKGRASGKNKYK